MDPIDPDLVRRAEVAMRAVDGVEAARDVRLRWVGHGLTGSATIEFAGNGLDRASAAADHAGEHVREGLRHVYGFIVTAVAAPHR